MTEIDDARLTYAKKIAKLLRQAEGTDNQAEADAFTAKAQRLMTTWAITDDLLAHAQGRQRQDKIVERTVEYTGTYHRALFEIGNKIARTNDCRTLIYKSAYATKLYVIGFEGDVERVIMLDASVQIQASTASRRFAREDALTHPYLTKMQRFKARREFLFGFADGVHDQLLEARERGIDDATRAEVERADVDQVTAQTSTALVLATKKEQVNDWIDSTYGTSIRSVRNRYSYGGANARSSGRVAGRAADVGQPRIGGTRQIGGRS